MSEKLKNPLRRDLQWFAARDHASTFGRGDPPLWRVTRMVESGLVAPVGHDSGRFGFVRYAITDAGRAALSKDEGS